MLGRSWDRESGVPGPLEPPSPQARNALLGRVDQLERQRGAAQDQLGRENEAKAAKAAWAADQVALAEGADAE